MVTYMVCAFLGLVGTAHATDQAATGPQRAAPSPSAEPEQRPPDVAPSNAPPDAPGPVDEDMLDYLDILVEMNVLDSLETIEKLEGVGAEEDEP